MESKISQYEGEEKIETPEPNVPKSQLEKSQDSANPKVSENSDQAAEQVESSAMESDIERRKKSTPTPQKPEDPQA